MPIRARQIWFFGPSLCLYAYGGSHFSWVPQPSSAVVWPSSRNPSMLQVLTNSSTCLGLSLICVSRSEQWITFTPSLRARWFHCCVPISSLLVAESFALE